MKTTKDNFSEVRRPAAQKNVFFPDLCELCVLCGSALKTAGSATARQRSLRLRVKNRWLGKNDDFNEVETTATANSISSRSSIRLP